MDDYTLDALNREALESRDRAAEQGPDAYDWEAHTAECPARAGSVYYCECGADPSRARGVDWSPAP